MGQAKINRSKKVTSVVVNNAEDFHAALVDGITSAVNKSYKKNSVDEKELLKALFYCKFVGEAFTMHQVMFPEKGQVSMGMVLDWYYSFTQEMLDKGSYPNWEEAMKEQTAMAMTYRCYEPWEWIVKNALQLAEGSTPEMFGKLINQLYDVA